MGLTVSRKTTKTLAVRRKNERILTVSRKKMLTVKSNHKIRSRDLLLTLMCYAFMCSGNLRSYWEQQIHRGYYTVARRYEFYFRVAKQY